MADERMPADTAQQMIDDAKRKAQGQEDFMGFRVPKGMDDDARKAWEAAIREREVLFRRDPPVDELGNEIIGAPRNPTAFQRKAKRYSEQVIGPTFEDLKQTATELPGKIGRGAKVVGEAVIDAATVVPRTKAAIAADPEGAKQFASNVVSGDREAIRSMATEASEGIVEPLATMGDAVLGGMAAQEGKPLEAVGYAGLILTPAIVQTLGKSMSKGWLKRAAEAGEEIPGGAAKKLDDLAKLVDEGKVTNDMQVRREIARVEDTYRREWGDNKNKRTREARRELYAKRAKQDEKALAAKSVKQKYMLYDPRTDEPFKTRGGKIKEFSSPEAADEYAAETLDDFTLKILDLDGKPAPGY